MSIDVSTALQVIPYNNGVKLSRPEETHAINKYPTVENALALPCNIYFLDYESKCQSTNELNMHAVNCYKKNDLLNKSMLHLFNRSIAQAIIYNDKMVMCSRTTKIVEEIIYDKDGFTQTYLSIKTPWYDEQNQLIGVFGCGILAGHHPLVESINGFMQLSGVFNQTREMLESNDVFFTPREKEIVNLLIRGKTAREIALNIRLSRRTVEHYIENIKLKMKVKTKSELIDKLYEKMGSGKSFY